MTNRITRTFVETATANTTEALRSAGIFGPTELLALRDSGGTKLPLRVDVMNEAGDHLATINGHCNPATALEAVEALRNLAHFADRPTTPDDEGANTRRRKV